MNPSAIASSVMTPQTYNPGPTSTYTGYTPYNQQGNNAIDSAQAALNPTTPSASAIPAPQKGNWFTHLLPTIGSFAGMAGGILGAPETGGLSLLAALALAGAGSAAGKVGEDVLQKQSINPEQVALSAGEGAGGQALGMGLGSIIGGIGGKVADTLTQGATDRAAQAATDTATQSAADEATRIGNEFGAVKPGAAQVGPAISKLQDLGITNPTAEDMSQIGKIYTGSNPETGTGVLNFYKQQALDQAGGSVNLDNTMTDLENNLKTPENTATLGDTTPVAGSRGQLPKAPVNTATKIIQQVRSMLPSGSLENGQITEQLTPQKGFSLLKDIGKQITQTTPKANALGVLDPADVAENNVWKSVYNSVKQAVYNRPEVDAAIQGIKVGPEESGVIDDAIKSNGIKDPQIAANIKADLTNVLNNSNTAQDLLDAERPMVNVAKVGDIQTRDVANNPQVARNVKAVKSQISTQNPKAPAIAHPLLDMGAVAGAIPTHGLSLLAALPEIASKVTNGTTGDMAAKLVQSGVARSVAKVLPTVLTGASQFITHAGDVTPNPVNLNLGSNNMQPQNASLDPNSLNSLLLQLAVAESANPTTSSAGASELGQLVPQMQNVNVAQNSLTGAENAFQQAGGGQGGIMGNLSRILGSITGNPASQYEQQRQQLIQQLNPLGIPTSAVPDITGNNQSAQNQFQTLQQMINARLNGGSVLNSIPAQ